MTDFRVLRGGAVVVEDGRIAAVLRAGSRCRRGRGSRSSASTGSLPGLVNAHNHLAYDALPPWRVPLARGKPLAGWTHWTSGPLREEYAERITEPKQHLLDVGLAAEVGKWPS